MMLEADVVLGKVTGQDVQQPIMAHPPANESDLSLENFLNTVIERKGIKKGVKLDFKTVEAFNASKPILDKVRDNVRISSSIYRIEWASNRLDSTVSFRFRLDYRFLFFFLSSFLRSFSVDIPRVPERRYIGRTH